MMGHVTALVTCHTMCLMGRPYFLHVISKRCVCVCVLVIRGLQLMGKLQRKKTEPLLVCKRKKRKKIHAAPQDSVVTAL